MEERNDGFSKQEVYAILRLILYWRILQELQHRYGGVPQALNYGGGLQSIEVSLNDWTVFGGEISNSIVPRVMSYGAGLARNGLLPAPAAVAKQPLPFAGPIPAAQSFHNQWPSERVDDDVAESPSQDEKSNPIPAAAQSFHNQWPSEGVDDDVAESPSQDEKSKQEAKRPPSPGKRSCY